MTRATKKNPFGLTHRECECVEALVRLGSPKAVAYEFEVDPKTVRNTLRQAGLKMRADTLILIAVKWVRNAREGQEFYGKRVNSVFALASNDNERAAA